MTRPSHPTACIEADPRLGEALRHLLAVTAVLVLLVPALRGHLTLIGWAPLWLLGAPALALAALRLARTPAAALADGAPRALARRRRAPQARRRHRSSRADGLPRAA